MNQSLISALMKFQHCISGTKLGIDQLFIQLMVEIILTYDVTPIKSVPRQFVYGHFVYDTSSTDISSTDNSSTTVYQRTGQLYIQLLFQQIIIFINSNFYLHYDSYIVSKHCGLTIQLVLSVSLKTLIFYQPHF